jgi:hypothetical protein
MKNYLGHTLFNNMRKYLRDRFDRLSSEKKMVYGSNLRMVRSGAIVEKVFDGESKFLIGRLQKHDEDSADGILKSIGGYFHLAGGIHTSFDTSVVDCLDRESSEEGIPVVRRTVRPLCVYLSPQKGVLQFCTADLESYPKMGHRSKAVYRRRKDHDVYVRWCSLDQLVDALHNDDSDILVQPETVQAVHTATYFEKSRRLRFSEDDLKSFHLKPAKDRDVAVPEDIRQGLINSTALSWLDPETSFGSCRIYYSFPKVEALEQGACENHVKVFFMTGMFLYEARIDDVITKSVLKRGKSINKRIRRKAIQSNARSFVGRNLRKVLSKDIPKLYLG